MDQDNALVFADGAPGGPEDRWFEKLGIHIADILQKSACPIARAASWRKIPQWRGSVATWRKRISDGSVASSRRISCPSTYSSTCARCMEMAVFARPSGAKRSMPRTAKSAFAKLLAEAAGSVESAFGFFRPIKNQGGPDRSEKDRPVRHRDHGACARHPPSCRGTFDASSACRRQGVGIGAESGSRRVGRGARNFPRSPDCSTDRRHRERNAAVKCSCSQTPVCQRS